MPIYEWKRRVFWGGGDHGEEVEGWEYEFTESHDTPPPGKGWKRVYSLSIGSVRGAGGSPARKVNTRGTD